MKKPAPHQGTGSLLNRFAATSEDSLPQPNLATSKPDSPRQGPVKAEGGKEALMGRTLSARQVAKQLSGVTAEDIEADREIPRDSREGKAFFDFDEVLEVIHQRTEKTYLDGSYE